MKRICIIIEMQDFKQMYRILVQQKFNDIANACGKDNVRWHEEEI